MMDSSAVVSEGKENFRLSQPTPSVLVGGSLFLVVEATSCLLTILSWQFSESSSCVNA